MARWIVSPGTLLPRALVMARRRRGLPSGSPPPRRAAEVISRMSLVNSLDRLASTAPLKCLTLLHLLCPDISPLVCWNRGFGTADFAGDEQLQTSSADFADCTDWDSTNRRYASERVPKL